jgi:hypothetical protein
LASYCKFQPPSIEDGRFADDDNFSLRSGCISTLGLHGLRCSRGIVTRERLTSRVGTRLCFRIILVRFGSFDRMFKSFTDASTGHYIENTSETQNLTFIEIYKSERVADVSLTQWLALTPADIVADVLKIPISIVQGLKKEKQVIVHGK